MKYKYIIALALFTSCAVTRPSQSIRLTVTYVHREGNIAQVQARNGYKWYKAKCTNLSDTVKVGTVITADPTQNKKLDCLFFRIK